MSVEAARLGISQVDYAAGLIRRDLDSGRTPNVQQIADLAALDTQTVNKLRDRILSGKRGTADIGRNIPTQVTPQPTPTAPDPDPREMVNHPDDEVRAAARAAIVATEALTKTLDELRDRLADVDTRRARAQRILELEAELDALRALQPGAVPTNRCPECLAVFNHRRNLTRHLRQTHGIQP